MKNRPTTQSVQVKKASPSVICGAGVTIASICLAVTTLTAGPAAAANAEKYCNKIAELATTFVDFRTQGRPYDNTLGIIDAIAAQSSFSGNDRLIFRRDARTAAKWVYIDFPTVTSVGMYKLARAMCLSE